MCKGVCVCICVCVCEGQKTTDGSQFAPSNILVMKLEPSLGNKTLSYLK